MDSLNIKTSVLCWCGGVKGASEFSTNTIYTAAAHNYHMGSTPRHKPTTLFLFIDFCRLCLDLIWLSNGFFADLFGRLCSWTCASVWFLPVTLCLSPSSSCNRASFLTDNTSGISCHVRRFIRHAVDNSRVIAGYWLNFPRLLERWR